MSAFDDLPFPTESSLWVMVILDACVKGTAVLLAAWLVTVLRELF